LKISEMRIRGKKNFFSLAAAVLLAVSVRAQTGLPSGQAEEIERAISSEMSRQGIPGLSVAVAAGCKLRWMAGFGLADVENFVPAKAATVYRLASVSKPVTAVAVMQLVESGKLDLDAPIQKYVPYFPRKKWVVTARYLLAHQAGIRHYRNGSELNSTRHYMELRQALGIFQDDPLLFKPGTKYSYSTYGYNLLGAAVEGASGRRFVDYIRERIFEPAGMRQIRPDDVYEIIPNRARGYRRILGGKLQRCALADTSNKIPGGGLCGTVEDLADFAIQLQAGQLLKKETLEAMFTVQKTSDGKATPYGLGWQIEKSGGKCRVEHGGAQQGVRTLLSMLPEEGFAVALMANIEGVRLRPLARRIENIVLREDKEKQVAR
jgi:serine beta-lactamase-like protein LACTB